MRINKTTIENYVEIDGKKLSEWTSGSYARYISKRAIPLDGEFITEVPSAEKFKTGRPKYHTYRVDFKALAKYIKELDIKDSLKIEYLAILASR